ncbi:hypothetical protein CYMTET_52405, partial [Cymbomonas tetramitiformis]
GHSSSAVGDECVRCHSKEMVMTTSAIFMVAVLGILGLMAMLISRIVDRMILSAHAARQHSSATMRLVDVKDAFSLLVGYFQVMGQLHSLYSSAVVPELLRRYSKVINLVNMDFGAMLNNKCLHYHFGTPSSALVGSNFMWSFWKSVSLPWLLCTTFLTMYFLATRRRAATRASRRLSKYHPEDSLARRQEEVTEMNWHFNMRATYIGAVLFMLTLFHPGIATNMFQIFNCREFYFDDPGLNVQYWMTLDPAFECFNGTWMFAMTTAIFMLVVYVFGYPLGLLLIMHSLRKFHKVRLMREHAERHIAQVEKGWWIPCNTQDAATMRLSQSLNSNQHLKRQRRASLVGYMHELSSRVSRFWKPQDAAELRLPQRAAAQWRAKVERRRNAVVEFYMLRSTFEPAESAPQVGAGEESEPSGKEESRENKSRGTERRISLVRTMFFGIQAPHSGFSPTPEQSSESMITSISLSDGQIIPDVICFQKADRLMNGLMHTSPVTRLDDPSLIQVLGQFTTPFSDQFYYWQCYEICRRLMQTGVVVMVSLFWGTSAALLYGLLVAFYATLVHVRYNPYKNPVLNSLQMIILVNQCCIQIILLAVAMEPKCEHIMEPIGLALQFLVLSYALGFVAIWLRPLYQELVALLNPLVKRASEHIKWASERRSSKRTERRMVNNELADENNELADEETMNATMEIPAAEHIYLGLDAHEVTDPTTKPCGHDEPLASKTTCSTSTLKDSRSSMAN